MKTLEWTTIDKSAWGPGAWQDEPDKRQWQDAATGLPCLMVRNQRTGNWCGYVGVPEGHPYYGKDYDSVDVDVHGGLTFADKCADVKGDYARHICHLPEPGEPDAVWWLGFDCHHFMDFAPGMQAFNERAFPGNPLFARDPSETYRTVAYVTRECEELARQLAEAAK